MLDPHGFLTTQKWCVYLLNKIPVFEGIDGTPLTERLLIVRIDRGDRFSRMLGQTPVSIHYFAFD